MSLSWSEIPFPSGSVDGDPVRGSVSEVQSVVTMFQRMGTAAENIHSTFATLRDEGGDSESLRGDSADRFREVIEEVAGTLGDLPGVADQAYTVLNDHLGKLEDLRTEAASALARANTRWEAYQTAQANAGAAARANDRLQSQADSLPADDPGVGDADEAAGDSATALTSALGLADDARSDLEASKTEWGDLRDDESDLNSETAGELDDISLGDLSDPSWWESLLGAAFDLLMDLTLLDELFALIEAIASGDWAAALWALKDILDVVLTVLAVVALFTPLGPLVIALSVVYLAATAALYFTQWPNPETGQTVGALDLAFAALDLVPGGRAVPTNAIPSNAIPTNAIPPGAVPTGAATPPGGAATPPPRAGDPPSGRPRGDDTPGSPDDPAPGVIYQRTDRNGNVDPYYGQSRDAEQNYAARQRSHNRRHPDADFEFEIVQRGDPTPGSAGGSSGNRASQLDRFEEDWIRRGGGPTNGSNPNGGTSNRRHQLNDERYRDAGGTEPMP